jgi:hypothetical protein
MGTGAVPCSGIPASVNASETGVDSRSLESKDLEYRFVPCGAVTVGHRVAVRWSLFGKSTAGASLLCLLFPSSGFCDERLSATKLLSPFRI